MSHLVYLGIGSNIEPEKHVSTGLNELSSRFDVFTISGVYRSNAVGFEGNAFMNLVLGANVEVGVGQLHAQLREIEYAFGRRKDCSKHSSRTLDIDILTFDKLHGCYDNVELPRDEITRNAFVLAPFSEIAPELVLPSAKASLGTLWQRYSEPSQKIQKIEFCWRGYHLPYQLPCRTRS